MLKDSDEKRSLGDKLLDLVERSVIFQGILVVMIAGTYCYIVAVGGQPPDALVDLLQIIVGFFFGAKSAVNAAADVRRYLTQLGLERRQEK